MYKQKSDAYYASEIADFLGRTLKGKNCVIYQPASLENLKDNSILFLCRRVCEEGFDVKKLEGASEILAIVYNKLSKKPNCSYILSPQPRLDFVKVLYHFFVREPQPGIHNTAIIEDGAVIGKNVFVGPNSYIGDEVKIGNNTQIFNNVVVSGKVKIGANCVIKSNTTIGSEGFSFVTESKKLEHFPQIGEIIIGNNVWLGANTTVERATLEATIIEDDVKIDDIVQIGHNSIIGKASQITAGTIICGRARIGKRVWVAPNVCIDSDVVVGDDAWVGMGAVVLKDVAKGTVVVGNPAKYLKKRKELKSFQ
jgi:UDP-3-O-[3-hydroxymyristoyl] glucosamine N-acyltransferase